MLQHLPTIMQVAVETISADAWEEDLTKSLPGLNATGVEHLRALWEIMCEGSNDQQLMGNLRPAQPRLGAILGKKPLIFEQELAGCTSEITAVKRMHAWEALVQTGLF